MSNEIWKDIEEYEGLYQISSLGNVISLDRYVKRWCYKSNKNVNHFVRGVVKKGWIKDNGYLAVKLHNDGSYKSFYIHRLVAKAFIHNPNNKPQVNHKNGIKDDNRMVNLEWVNNSENLKHSYDKGIRSVSDSTRKKIGKSHQGELSSNSILEKEDVIEIRKIAKRRGYRYGLKELSNKYRVSRGTISDVVQRRTWNHI